MDNFDEVIVTICNTYGSDSSGLMDILRDTQQYFNCVSDEAIDAIAKETQIPRVEVESTVSFYHYFSKKPKGKCAIYLCDDIVDQLNGLDPVVESFQEELKINVGETTEDGLFSLDFTPCIGMSDQAPAALINDVVVTNLDPKKVKKIVKELKKNADPDKLSSKLGDGNNAHALVHSMVKNNIQQKGEILFSDSSSAEKGLKSALEKSPGEVIDIVKGSGLRGRGGAGFPTGMKWDFTTRNTIGTRCVLCNADEGEPGTFKDRVLLTEMPDVVFEGMTIAGYAIGADTGIIYLRGEYAYLKEFLEETLVRRQKEGLLGKDILGIEGFNFTIRIQLGAGAYICGEETALISSLEGLGGYPKNRPPFPAKKGYYNNPSIVNNVETFCDVARILDLGANLFKGIGTKLSNGTKLLSVSGDCKKPGIYEVPFGLPLKDLLSMAGAEDVLAVQVGGPSGELVGKEGFERTVSFEDLSTGGSIMIFSSKRNVLEVVHYFAQFFYESCGYCSPCRVGTVLMKKCLDKIIAGNGVRSDLEYLNNLGSTMKKASRCGLGQTAANPVISSIKNFPSVYEQALKEGDELFKPEFDLEKAVGEFERIAVNYK